MNTFDGMTIEQAERFLANAKKVADYLGVDYRGSPAALGWVNVDPMDDEKLSIARAVYDAHLVAGSPRAHE